MQYAFDPADDGNLQRARSPSRAPCCHDSSKKEDDMPPMGWLIRGFRHCPEINGCYVRNDTPEEYVHVNHPDLGSIPTPAYWKLGCAESAEVFAFWQEVGKRRYVFCLRWGNNQDLWQAVKDGTTVYKDPGVAFFSPGRNKWYEWSEERMMFLEAQIFYQAYHTKSALSHAHATFEADLKRNGDNQNISRSRSMLIPSASTPPPSRVVPGTPVSFFQQPPPTPTSGTAAPSTPTGYAGTRGPAGSAAPSTPTGYPLTPAGTCSKGNMSKEHVLPPGSGECIVVQDDSDDGCDTSWKDWFTWNHNNRGGQY